MRKRFAGSAHNGQRRNGPVCALAALEPGAQDQTTFDTELPTNNFLRLFEIWPSTPRFFADVAYHHRRGRIGAASATKSRERLVYCTAHKSQQSAKTKGSVVKRQSNTLLQIIDTAL